MQVITPDEFILTEEKKVLASFYKRAAVFIDLLFSSASREGPFPQSASVTTLENLTELKLSPVLPYVKEMMNEAGWLVYLDRFNNHLVLDVHPLYNPSDEYWN